MVKPYVSIINSINFISTLEINSNQQKDTTKANLNIKIHTQYANAKTATANIAKPNQINSNQTNT